MDAIENRYVATCDVPGAFMHSYLDEQVHLKLEGEIAELLIKVDPTYAEFVSKEKGKTVIYTELSKALYGTIQAALLFWKNLSTFLIKDQGFQVNPYDWCVVNKRHFQRGFDFKVLISNRRFFRNCWILDSQKTLKTTSISFSAVPLS